MNSNVITILVTRKGWWGHTQRVAAMPKLDKVTRKVFLKAQKASSVEMRHLPNPHPHSIVHSYSSASTFVSAILFLVQCLPTFCLRSRYIVDPPTPTPTPTPSPTPTPRVICSEDFEFTHSFSSTLCRPTALYDTLKRVVWIVRNPKQQEEEKKQQHTNRLDYVRLDHFLVPM